MTQGYGLYSIERRPEPVHAWTRRHAHPAAPLCGQCVYRIRQRSSHHRERDQNEAGREVSTRPPIGTAKQFLGIEIAPRKRSNQRSEALEGGDGTRFIRSESEVGAERNAS